MIQDFSRKSGPAPETGAPTATQEGDLHRRLEAVRQHGDFTISYSAACQPGLKHHWYQDGFQAFASKWGFDFALGDPVIHPDRRPALIDSFMERCRRKPCFVNIMRGTAELLAERGYYINQLGIDTWLELDDYDFRGKKKEPFRYAENWLKRRDYQVREMTFDQLGVDQAADVSRQWRSTRTVKHREVGFLNRPLVLEDEPDVRKFFLFDSQDRLQAFIFLDPVYRDDDVTGYSTVIKRRLPDAPVYAEQGIMKHCVDQLKREGRETLRLGLSPLASLTDRTFEKRNPLLHFAWTYGYRAWWVNRFFYNLKGHASYKRRFRGTEFPVYFASPVLFNDFRITALLRLMGVLGGERSAH